MPTVQQQRDKLVNLLKELFQLDQPDLDFGFYKIMHAKAKQVTAFLENDLLKIVEEKFGENNAARVAQLQKAYEDAVAQAKSFGSADPEQTDPVRRARAALEAAKDTSRAEGEVYDHLYRFFERYYDAGDFMSRRYLSRETSSKAAAYAVPYDGSEVYMHWANKDQYYIKTAEYFTDFTFDPTQAMEVKQADGLFQAPEQPLRVHFRIVAATEGEHGNVKVSETAKRHFLLHKEAPIVIENGELTVRFEYRPDPEKTGQEKTWQAKRNEEAVAGILKALTELDNAQAKEYLAILKVPSPTERQADRPLLAKYVAQYTARNTMDYFIHKDLGGFLRRELDFYIKNEVMRLDDIESADAPKVDQYLEQIKVLRQIAGKMIDFLTQLENFQKKLWLKKKFVTECHYCITLDRVPEEFYSEIAANNAQREEWVRLFAIDEIKRDLHKPAYSKPLTEAFLKTNPFLVLDTAFFDDSFRGRLLASLYRHEERASGLLVHSDNFQAVSLLQVRYRGDISVIYIDPPYNTSENTFVYKNSYKHSSWIAMMSSRLEKAVELLVPGGVLEVAIDDTETQHLRMVLDSLLGEDNRVATIAAEVNPAGQNLRPNTPALSHDYCYVYSTNINATQMLLRDLTEEETATYDETDGNGSFLWDNLRRRGGNSRPSDRPGQWFPLFIKGNTVRVPEMDWDASAKKWIVTEKPGEDEIEVWPIDPKAEKRIWRVNPDGARKDIASGNISVTTKVGRQEVIKKSYMPAGKKPKTLWKDSKHSATTHGTKLLIDLIGKQLFSYPKSLFLVMDCLRFWADDDAVVMDFFAGSGTTGHAVTRLNAEDGGQRRYILAEMGDYFESVLKPRLMKVAYSQDWRNGKPTSRDTGVSQMFKYIRLESYEDCLNNLELKDDSDRNKSLVQNTGLREDYMLHYMLDVETRGSASLLNVDQFADPTAYKLKVKQPGSDEYDWRNVDLLETFNYLIGLRVEHIAVPQVFTAKFDHEKDPDLPEGQLGRLVLKGRLKQDPDGKWWFRKVEGWVPKNPQTPNDGQQEKVLIVWRKLTGDIEQDNLVLDEWFRKYQINPRESYDYDTIYVNGSNNLPNLKLENENWRVRLIEEDFHRLMWNVEEI